MYITGSYHSTILKRDKKYVAVLPKNPNKSTKVIFLLHGFGGNELTWSLNVPLFRYAEDYNVSFFCPSGENSFYTDHLNEEKYGEAIGEEFYHLMKQTFSLNFEYENVKIAGFSMGGYGALLLGLRFSRIYSQVGSFSPAFVFYKKARNEAHYNHVFSKGDYDSENDCVFLYQKLFENSEKIPFISFACGTEDPLFRETKLIIEQLKKINPSSNLEFFSQKGFHDFSLWENDLVRFLERLDNT